jgi:hypothetical protein
VDVASVFTTIGQIRDIKGPSMSAEIVDVTTRDSAWKEELHIINDAGEVTFDIVFDPDLTSHSVAGTASPLNFFLNGTLKSYKITFADAAPAVTVTFSAYVSKFEANSPQMGAQSADVTLRITGAPTWA